MYKVVTFLRGVNMAGHNKIKMAELKKLVVGLGYSDAETYIQSGNIVFTPAEGEKPGMLEKKLKM